MHNPCRLGGPHRFKRGGGQNQKWPTSGPGGYITPATLGVPTASEPGAESKVAHKWAGWLHDPCRLGGPHRFRAGGQNRKWPPGGLGGCITPAALGFPTVSERGAVPKVARKWAGWLHNPFRLGGPHRFRAGGQDQKWPTSRPGGYITPAALGVPTVSERGAKSKVAHKWAGWLYNPYRLGGPHRFRAWGSIKSGPQVGRVAT